MIDLLGWTYIIAVLTAIACSLAGVLLVVKREALVSEGLSHAVLPGIVLAFLIFRDRSSPLLILAAGLSGLLMVWLVQWIAKTGRVKHCLLYTSPSPRDRQKSRMPSSA